MRQIADKVGAVYIFDMAHIAGLVAGGVHPSPVPHAHITTTTTHKTLRGPRAGHDSVADKDLAAARIDKAVFPGQQGGPLMHIVAAKAVAFGEALRPEFKTYAAQIVANAKALAQGLQEAGYRIISGGTDNHLMLVDVFEKGILGSEAELALGKAGITVNKNSIPYDTNPPLKPSGIRVGTPALTTRGMKEPEMRQIAAGSPSLWNSATTMRLSTGSAARSPRWQTISRFTHGAASLPRLKRRFQLSQLTLELGRSAQRTAFASPGAISSQTPHLSCKV